jgi:hypothetical protein
VDEEGACCEGAEAEAEEGAMVMMDGKALPVVVVAGGATSGDPMTLPRHKHVANSTALYVQ